MFGLTRDSFGRDVTAVAIGMGGSNGFAVQLSEKNVRDGMMHGVGSVLKEVREAYRRRPSRSRMVVLREVKRRNRMSNGGIGARGLRTRYCSSKSGTSGEGTVNPD